MRRAEAEDYFYEVSPSYDACLVCGEHIGTRWHFLPAEHLVEQHGFASRQAYWTVSGHFIAGDITEIYQKQRVIR